MLLVNQDIQHNHSARLWQREVIITENRWAGPQHCQILHKLHLLLVLAFSLLCFNFFFFKKTLYVLKNQLHKRSVADNLSAQISNAGERFKMLSLCIYEGWGRFHFTLQPPSMHARIYLYAKLSALHLQLLVDYIVSVIRNDFLGYEHRFWLP